MAGRPTKYESNYCEEVVEFFNRQPFEVIFIEDDEGNKTVALDKRGKPILKPCKLPTIEGFAIKIGVHRDTIHEWTKKHEEFSDSIKRAKDIQKEILIQNGLIGAYEKTFAIFVAKNVTDMNDKQEVEVSGDLTPWANIEAGVDE